MSKKQVPLLSLQDYLPENTYPEVAEMLNKYKVHLTVTRQRQSVLGDYRHEYLDKAHRISVNGNLNKYSFLITLLHELAHLFTFENHRNKVPPHGKEWKQHFSSVLKVFLSKNIFPADIEGALQKTLKNPAASSCGDENLLRVLRNYDAKKEGHFLVEEIASGMVFILKDGRRFIRGEKIRKRYKCMEIDTKKQYLFSGLYEVKIIDAEKQP
jgi:predicted SprT family Zn-dependent metalloprotease